jgi:putative transcriptional regulator
MTIVVNLDVMLAKRKMKSNELAQLVGITEQNISILKTGKAKAGRQVKLVISDQVKVLVWEI